MRRSALRPTTVCLALAAIVLTGCGAGSTSAAASCEGPPPRVDQVRVAAGDAVVVSVQYLPCVDGATVYDGGRVAPFTSSPVTDAGVWFDQAGRTEELVRSDADLNGRLEAEVHIPAWSTRGAARVHVDGAEPVTVTVTAP